MEFSTPPEKLPAEGSSVWRPSDLGGSNNWTYALSSRERQEILAAANAASMDVEAISPSVFPLPTLGPKLQRIQREVIDGRGFALIRGFPLGTAGLKTVAEAARAFWGLGGWLGEAISQNKDGCLLGHVCDVGASADHPHQRGFQSPDGLPYHTDVAGDVIALLCLRPARSGGASSIASAGAIHNALLAESPALVDALSQSVAWDRRGEIPQGARPWYLLPVFSHHRGRLLTSFVRRFLEGAQQFPDAPRASETLLRAIARLTELAADPSFHLEMDFQPGDIQLVNNHAILHNRTAYEDSPDPRARRHLLRLWLAATNGWALPQAHYARYTTRAANGRPGGITTPQARPHVPLSPAG